MIAVLYSVVPPPAFIKVLVVTGVGNTPEDMTNVPCPLSFNNPAVNCQVERSRNPPSSIVISSPVVAIFAGRVTVRPGRMITKSSLDGTDEPTCVVPLGSSVHVLEVFQLPV